MNICQIYRSDSKFYDSDVLEKIKVHAGIVSIDILRVILKINYLKVKNDMYIYIVYTKYIYVYYIVLYCIYVF